MVYLNSSHDYALDSFVFVADVIKDHFAKRKCVSFLYNTTQYRVREIFELVRFDNMIFFFCIEWMNDECHVLQLSSQISKYTFENIIIFDKAKTESWLNLKNRHLYNEEKKNHQQKISRLSISKSIQQKEEREGV